MKFQKYFSLIAILFSLVFLNQNCGNFAANDFSELSSTHSPSILDIDLPSYKTRLGDRSYIASTMASAFLPQGDSIARNQATSLVGDSIYRHLHSYITSNYNDSQDQALVDIIEDQILTKADDFGGPCYFVEGDQTCITNRNDQAARTSETGRDIISSSTSVREGYRINACTQIVARNRAITNFIFNVTGQRNTNFSFEDHAEKAYSIFYTRPYNDDVEEGLRDLYSSIQSGGENNIDTWRLIVSALCKSPGWQIP